MVLAARFPDVERARRRINEADRKIREALEMGHTWHNTPWPNYRVIFDEQGMAVDVVEVEAGDEEETDEDENELREVWAKFENEVCPEVEHRFGLFLEAPRTREAGFESMWQDPISHWWVLDYYFSN